MFISILIISFCPPAISLIIANYCLYRKIQNQKPVSRKALTKQLVLPVNKSLLLKRTTHKKRNLVETVAPVKKFNK